MSELTRPCPTPSTLPLPCSDYLAGLRDAMQTTWKKRCLSLCSLITSLMNCGHATPLTASNCLDGLMPTTGPPHLIDEQVPFEEGANPPCENYLLPQTLESFRRGPNLGEPQTRFFASVRGWGEKFPARSDTEARFLPPTQGGTLKCLKETGLLHKI